MFKRFSVYTHVTMRDCCFLVLKSFLTPSGYYKLKVRWLRKDGMDFGIIDNIKITREQNKNYSEIQPSKEYWHATTT